MLVESGSIVTNDILSDDVRCMVIQVPSIAAEAEPGQFVMVKNENGGTFLRRPFGIADVDREQGRILRDRQDLSVPGEEHRQIRHPPVINVRIGTGQTPIARIG